MLSRPMYRSRCGTVRIASAMSLVVLLAVSIGCAAQTRPDTAPVAPAPPVGAEVPPPPPSANAPVPLPLGAERAPASLVDEGMPVTTQATVSRFLTNPDGDVDGFLTSEGALVRFPPHMSADLTSMVRPGDSVQLSGWRDTAGNLKAQRIVDMRSGQQLIDHPPLPGAQPLPAELHGAGLSRLNAQGEVAYVTTAPRGEPDGVILADGTVIKLTPPVAQQFPGLVRTGARVSAQGYGTRNQYGMALQATAFGSPGKLTLLYDRPPPRP